MIRYKEITKGNHHADRDMLQQLISIYFKPYLNGFASSFAERPKTGLAVVKAQLINDTPKAIKSFNFRLLEINTVPYPAGIRRHAVVKLHDTVSYI